MFFTNLATPKKTIATVTLYCLIGSIVISSGIGMVFFDGHSHLGPERKLVPAANQMKNNLKVKQTGQISEQAVIQNKQEQLSSYQVQSNKKSDNNNSYQKTSYPTTSAQSKPIPESDLPLLARIIHAEAGGETLKGQVAVGAVLLNRIRSGKFPQTLAANIFKPGEFESVSNGYIWSEPTANSYRAARLAMNGWDPTYGALYFFNPAKSSSGWIWSRTVKIVIGQHHFAT